MFWLIGVVYLEFDLSCFVVRGLVLFRGFWVLWLWVGGRGLCVSFFAWGFEVGIWGMYMCCCMPVGYRLGGFVCFAFILVVSMLLCDLPSGVVTYLAWLLAS